MKKNYIYLESISLRPCAQLPVLFSASFTESHSQRAEPQRAKEKLAMKKNLFDSDIFREILIYQEVNKCNIHKTVPQYYRLIS
jgi:hypothetical protein